MVGLVELAEMVKPKNVIEIIILKEKYAVQHFHVGGKLRTRVAEAQNLMLLIRYTALPRRGGRTLYINNI
jgi:hypothetical protein